MLKLFKLLLTFLVSLGERGEIGNESELDTSESVGSITEPDTGGGSEVETGEVEQPAVPSDWRVTRYGPEWEQSLEYHRDTNKYLRGELDRAKKTQPRRTIDEPAEVKQAKVENDPYADVKSVPDVFKRVESMLSEREKEANWRASLQNVRANETGDPEKGIPSFDELEQEQLIPFFEANPAVKQIIREFPNPGQAMYTLAFLLKYPSIDKLRALFAGKARHEMGQRINEVSKEAVRLGGRRDGATSSKLTPEQIRNMSSAEFAKLEAQNTGRRA